MSAGELSRGNCPFPHFSCPYAIGRDGVSCGSWSRRRRACVWMVQRAWTWWATRTASFTQLKATVKRIQTGWCWDVLVRAVPATTSVRCPLALLTDSAQPSSPSVANAL